MYWCFYVNWLKESSTLIYVGLLHLVFLQHYGNTEYIGQYFCLLVESVAVLT